MMKIIATQLIILSSFLCVSSQVDDSKNLWGAYLIQKEEEMLLNLCEKNSWFFANCHLGLVEIVHEPEYDCLLSIQFGTYEIVNNKIELLNYSGELIFSFNIIDTMNIQVTYAKYFLDIGDFLNRRSSFFEGHTCSSSVSYSDFYARWTVSELKQDEFKMYYEITRFREPGYIFGNDTYEVEQLHYEIYKRK